MKKPIIKKEIPPLSFASKLPLVNQKQSPYMMTPIFRRSFTLKEKLHFIELHKEEGGSNRAFSESHGIHESSFRGWLKQEELLRTESASKKRISMRKIRRKEDTAQFPEIERRLTPWLGVQKQHVKDDDIRRQALSVRDDIILELESTEVLYDGTEETVEAEKKRIEALRMFKASKLWCYRFKARQTLALQRLADS